MPKHRKPLLKEIAGKLAISCFFAAIVVFLFYLFAERKVDSYLTLLSNLSYSPTYAESLNEAITFNTESRALSRYPSYGTEFATIKIEKIGLERPVIHGDTLDILKNNIGHLSGSYFPGEGHGIVIDAHNSNDMFGRLPELEIGDRIVITTDYGVFTYEMYESTIIDKSDVQALRISSDEENLTLYTCYPVNTAGLLRQRYVVYAKLVEANYE